MYTKKLIFESDKDKKDKAIDEAVSFTGSVDLSGANNIYEALEKYNVAKKEKRIEETVMQTEVAILLKQGIKAILLQDDYSDRPDILGMIMTRVESDAGLDYYPAFNEPRIKEVQEAEDYPLTGYKTEYASIYNKKYGAIVEISMEAINRTKGDYVRQQARALRNAHLDWEIENITTDLFNNGSSLTLFDGATFFATAGRPSFLGGATVATNTNSGALGQISESNLQTALTEISQWQRRSGKTGWYTPKYLMVAPSEEWVTRRLMQSAYRDAAQYGHTKNVHYNRMEVIVNPFLSNQTWYVLTSHPGLIYSVESDLSFSKEAENTGGSFWADLYRFKSSKSFGYGCIQWRCAYKGN